MKSGLIVVVLLAGCQLRPDALPAAPSQSAAWRGDSFGEGWPSATWWRAFNSTELDRLIVEAQRNNASLAASIATVTQADAQARIAGAALLPSVTFEPDASAVRRHNSLGHERHFGDFFGEFDASYDFDVWGKNQAALQAARFTASSAALDSQVVKLTITASVASTYFQVLELDDALNATKQDLATARTILGDVQALQTGGLGTVLQVVQQQTVVAQVAQQIPPLEEEQAHALDALAVLTGQPAQSIRLQAETLDGITAPAPRAGLPSALLTHRPDVQAAERNLLSANANIVVARAQFLPDISLSADVGLESLAVAGGETGADTIYDIALSALQPVFEGGRLRGQLQYSRAVKAQMLANYIETTRQAYADVENALASVDDTGAGFAADQAVLAKAEETLKLTGVSYAGGASNILAVLGAEATVFPNRIAVAQARGAYLQSLVTLYKALGGGWSVAS